MSVSLSEVFAQLHQARAAFPIKATTEVIRRLRDDDLPQMQCAIATTEGEDLVNAALLVGAAVEELNKAVESFRQAQRFINDYLLLKQGDGVLGKGTEFIPPNPAGRTSPNPCGFQPQSVSLVEKELKSWNSKRYQFGNRQFILAKPDMKHILTRHHPKYWLGEIKSKQSFLDKELTTEEVEILIEEVLRNNREKLIMSSFKMPLQIKWVIRGRVYTVGIRRGHIGQLYSEAIESDEHD